MYTHTESARTKAFFSNLNADIEKIIDNVVSDENVPRGSEKTLAMVGSVLTLPNGARMLY